MVVSKYRGWINLRSQRINRLDSLWWKDLKEVWRFEGFKGSFEDRFYWEIGSGREISL